MRTWPRPHLVERSFGEGEMNPVFDKTHRDPADITAAKVISKGEQFTPNQKTHDMFHSETCPPLRKVPWGSQNVDNLIGKRIGRLVVIGLAQHKKTTGKPQRWVVRCDCGDYEYRSARAIRNPDNHGDRCLKCRKFAQIKRAYEMEKTGIKLDVRKL